MKKNVLVAIRSPRESAREFAEVWRRAEGGDAPKQPIETLYFEDLGILLKVLTPARLYLLKALHVNEPLSIRALAGKVGRDYKNVHNDIQMLERFGLITRSAEGKLTAPYAKIVAEIALAA